MIIRLYVQSSQLNHSKSIKEQFFINMINLKKREDEKEEKLE